jgi:hypothetical protein
MTFKDFLGSQLAMALCSGLALGVLLSVAMLFTGGIAGKIGFDIELERFDGLYSIILIPCLLAILVVLVSPLAFALLRLMQRLRGSRN